MLAWTLLSIGQTITATMKVSFGFSKIVWIFELNGHKDCSRGNFMPGTVI